MDAKSVFYSKNKGKPYKIQCILLLRLSNGEWCDAAMQRCGVAARWLMAAERSEAVAILCGRGDKKTKKGKRFKGSYGNSRPKKEKMIERIKEKVEVPTSTPWPLPFKLI